MLAGGQLIKLDRSLEDYSIILLKEKRVEAGEAQCFPGNIYISAKVQV
jgi:hypothetical protein